MTTKEKMTSIGKPVPELPVADVPTRTAVDYQIRSRDFANWMALYP